MFLPLKNSRNLAAAFSTFELKAPANPRSPVTSTSRIFCSGRCASRGCLGSPVFSSTKSVRLTSERNTLVIIRAYGRAASARSCARRSLAAETIFMALVICRVFFTLRMRRRMSRMFAIALSRGRRRLLLGRLTLADKLPLVLLDDLRHRSARVIVQHFLLFDRLQHARV